MNTKMTAEKLYAILSLAQNARGYYFNNDRRQTMLLLNSLLVNHERYGYMSCPCRLATGRRERDRDIICPCVYREADVGEFGTCFCGLYVAEKSKEKFVSVNVPERRRIDVKAFE